jgi:hypothetical protein
VTVSLRERSDVARVAIGSSRPTFALAQGAPGTEDTGNTPERPMTIEATWTDRAAVTGEYARKALYYTDSIKRLVAAAKNPGFDERDWDEITAIIDTARFERVGNDKAVMGWDVYRELITRWATTTDYWDEFRRVSEAGQRVFLELTEHNTPRGGAESVVNSCSVYQFDEAGKLVHLDIYLQHA